MLHACGVHEASSPMQITTQHRNGETETEIGNNLFWPACLFVCVLVPNANSRKNVLITVYFDAWGDAKGKPVRLEDGVLCTGCSYGRNEIFAVCASSKDPAPVVPPMEQENVNRSVHLYFPQLPIKLSKPAAGNSSQPFIKTAIWCSKHDKHSNRDGI
jgi:hypothetical protein